VDVPVPADYQGNGKISIAVYRPPTAQWFVYGSFGSGTSPYGVQFGSPGDIPVPGDYTDSGQTELATFTPSTAVWTISIPGPGPIQTKQFGWPGVDIPIPAPYQYRVSGLHGAGMGFVSGDVGLSKSLDFGQQALGLATSGAPAASVSRTNSVVIAPSSPSKPALGVARKPVINHAPSKLSSHHVVRHVPAHRHVHDTAMELVLGSLGRRGVNN
jgi:hypothetical protein